jgi:hypothetical protein
MTCERRTRWSDFDGVRWSAARPSVTASSVSVCVFRYGV